MMSARGSQNKRRSHQFDSIPGGKRGSVHAIFQNLRAYHVDGILADGRGNRSLSPDGIVKCVFFSARHLAAAPEGICPLLVVTLSLTLVAPCLTPPQVLHVMKMMVRLSRLEPSMAPAVCIDLEL